MRRTCPENIAHNTLPYKFARMLPLANLGLKATLALTSLTVDILQTRGAEDNSADESIGKNSG